VTGPGEMAELHDLLDRIQIVPLSGVTISSTTHRQERQVRVKVDAEIECIGTDRLKLVMNTNAHL